MKGLLRKAVAGTEGTRSRSASLLLTPPPPSPRGVTRLIPAHRVHRFSSLHARRPPAAMERGSGEAGAPTAAQVPAAAAAAAGGGGVVKGKSCKGCLYFSSVLRSRARGPVCVGVTRAIPEVPERMIGEIELEAIREGRNLSDFTYGCVGYSIYLDDKGNPGGKQEKRAQVQLPICVGVELLADRRASNKEASPYLKKDAPQPPRYKPGHTGDDFLTKFQRNAGLVANGVANNLNKVGTYVKDTVGDMMNPYRKRPK